MSSSNSDVRKHEDRGAIDRRTILKGGTATGASAVASRILATHGLAQDASPGASPEVGSGSPSITRAQYQQALDDHFPFESPDAQGGSLVYGETNDLQTLNPILTSDSYSGLVIRLMYQYLVDGSAIDGTLVPWLADSWEQDADGVTYRFHLNPNSVWHDGTKLTAADVAFSFDIILDESGLSPRQSTVTRGLKSYRAIDDLTFELVSTAPRATFVEETAGLVGIIPRHIWEGVAPGDFGSDPGSVGTDPARVVGSGPFRFKEWVVGDHVTLVRNDDYWIPEDVPVVDEFIYRVIPEASALVQAIRTGEVDISSIDYGQAASLAESTDLIITSYDTAGLNLFDVMQRPERSTFFLDARVRQALMFALDRDLLAETVYLGYAITAHGTQPVLSIAYAPDRITTTYTFDPDQATKLLDEAGWIDSDGDGIRERDGKAFSFECLYSEGTAAYEQQIPYMQQAWREIGIDMQPTALPFTTLSDRGGASDYDMRVRGFTWSVSGGQGTMFRCDSLTPAGFNSMHYCNEEYDRLDDEQAAELDLARRVEILIDQTNIINDDVAIGALVFRQAIVGNQPRIHNFFPNGYSVLWGATRFWIGA